MFDLMTSNNLKEVLTEISTFQNIDRKNKVFQDYWKACKTLCEIMLDKK